MWQSMPGAAVFCLRLLAAADVTQALQAREHEAPRVSQAGERRNEPPASWDMGYAVPAFAVLALIQDH